MRQRWEYLLMTARLGYGNDEARLSIWHPGAEKAEVHADWKMNEVLNELGAEGWELCDRIVDGNIAYPGYSKDDAWTPAVSYPREFKYVMKRPA